MNWIDLDTLRLPHRNAILEVSRIDQVNFPELATILATYKDTNDPVELERNVRAMIVSLRPELTGVSIYHIWFDVTRQAWSFGVTHPSFPSQVLGCEPVRYPLIPETALVG